MSNTDVGNVQEKYLLVLYSKEAGSRQQTANTDMCLTIFRAKGITPVLLDASDILNRDDRDKLFGISGIRGNFPQVFRVDGTTTTFIGGFDSIQDMNDEGTLLQRTAITRPDSQDSEAEISPDDSESDSSNTPAQKEAGDESSARSEDKEDAESSKSRHSDLEDHVDEAGDGRRVILGPSALRELSSCDRDVCKDDVDMIEPIEPSNEISGSGNSKNLEDVPDEKVERSNFIENDALHPSHSNMNEGDSIGASSRNTSEQGSVANSSSEATSNDSRGEAIEDESEENDSGWSDSNGSTSDEEDPSDSSPDVSLPSSDNSDPIADGKSDQKQHNAWGMTDSVDGKEIELPKGEHSSSELDELPDSLISTLHDQGGSADNDPDKIESQLFCTGDEMSGMDDDTTLLPLTVVSPELEPESATDKSMTMNRPEESDLESGGNAAHDSLGGNIVEVKGKELEPPGSHYEEEGGVSDRFSDEIVGKEYRHDNAYRKVEVRRYRLLIKILIPAAVVLLIIDLILIILLSLS